ncbi:MAG TPA: hypothetical protein PK669_00670 [Methanosarcina thermophila]|uniref:Uncharacterized protein n=2 Tax=Methanosarcina thermophila TaxID=2210 RepID=A0A3G9CZH9_METTE|nr:hypothetical protein [Methanosarcina thermophila]AKB12682.1 hypothetical protein MSTHT_0924 [Methanosarcina thermophila TM-1]BAW30417.1 conserved hypothetical protein [Methanosarcina thermophila]HOA68808.1 hypothetical protein [Methanosarcina thermophila]HOQ64882.1 hypothetical protein [Methanosarcina thermophila]HPT80901.1 hypothetical protein [Methanosarcina thermophila]
MVEKLPPEFIKELERVSRLHEQAVCDHEKCREFSEGLSSFLVKVEDMKFYRTADRLMSILLNCSPKEASHCEKATLVGEMMKEITKEVQKASGK